MFNPTDEQIDEAAMREALADYFNEDDPADDEPDEDDESLVVEDQASS